MPSRIGFYIIHNSNHKLVHWVDVPWDFGTNAEDGTVIKPNPIPPPEEEIVEGFSWNDIQMERMILHIQRKLHRRRRKHRHKPFILQEAVFIFTPSLAEKLGVVTIENEDLKEGIYLKRYPDLKTEIYLMTTDELESEYEMIVRLPNDVTKIILFDENNLPNFEDVPELPEEPDGGETDPENPEGEGENGTNPDPEPPEEIDPPEIEYTINEDVMKNLIEAIPVAGTKFFCIYTSFQAAIDSNMISTISSFAEGDNSIILPELPLTFDYIGNRVIITDSLVDSNDIWIVPATEKPVKAIFTNDSIEVEDIPEEPTPSNEDLFINWFIKYFHKVLLKDNKFLNHFNNDRTYVVITQDNENIMGLMTLYKGRSVLTFKNHNYAELIDNKFPDIRDDMIFKDESFGGYTEDEGFLVDKENNGVGKPGHFGGFADDTGFLI